MKNLILSQGDTVVYSRHNPNVGRYGFGIGTVCRVERGPSGELTIQNGVSARLTLVDSNGELTEWSDYFVKAKGETLPRGIN